MTKFNHSTTRVVSEVSDCLCDNDGYLCDYHKHSTGGNTTKRNWETTTLKSHPESHPENKFFAVILRGGTRIIVGERLEKILRCLLTGYGMPELETGELVRSGFFYSHGLFIRINQIDVIEPEEFKRG